MIDWVVLELRIDGVYIIVYGGELYAEDSD